MRDINTTHSTRLDTFVLMSAVPFVRGNKSSRIHRNISDFRPVWLNSFVSGNISTVFGNPYEMGLFREQQILSSQPLLLLRVHGISSPQPYSWTTLKCSSTIAFSWAAISEKSLFKLSVFTLILLPLIW